MVSYGDALDIPTWAPGQRIRPVTDPCMERKLLLILGLVTSLADRGAKNGVQDFRYTAKLLSVEHSILNIECYVEPPCIMFGCKNKT